MKSQQKIWLQLLSYTYKTRDDVFREVFKVMAMLVTAYYLACVVSFLCFAGYQCRHETVFLLLVFFTSLIALGMLLAKKIKASVIFFTVLLPLCVLAISFIQPSIDLSTSILLVAILSLLVTDNLAYRVIKFLVHTAIFVFIQLRYVILDFDDTHQHLSLFNIILLPFGCLFFIIVFSRINKAFRFYREQHQQKRQHLSDANENLKDLLSQESKQQQKLKRTVAFKQQLISILSHDIRTPLYAYRMLIDGYEKKYYTDKDLVKEFVNSKEELIKIDEMTSDLVKGSRADAAPQPQDNISYEQLVQSFDAIQMIYAKSLKNKNITAKFFIGIAEGQTLCIGRRQLETIVRNLLSNAIKFSYAGSEIGIAISQSDTKPSHALLLVKDTGVGMPELKLKELNKASLISGKGTANEAGLGIGLSIVFDMLNRNELIYKIESQPGKGTSFKIWIGLKNDMEGKPVEKSAVPGLQ